MASDANRQIQLLLARRPSRPALAWAGALACWAGISLATPSLAGASAAWLAPQALTEPTNTTSLAGVAMDQQGTTIVTSTANDGTNYRADAQIRPPGGTFGPITPVSPRGANAQSPSVAFDSQGDAIMVWEREGIIQAALRPPGGSFGPAEDVSRGGESASLPRVIFDSQGDAIVVWSSRTGIAPLFTLGIQSNVRPAGGSFGAPQQLDTATPSTESQQLYFYPAPLAADQQGDVFAEWSFSSMEIDGLGQTTYTIKAAVRPAAGPFQPATTLANEFGEGIGEAPVQLRSPAIAADPQGDAMAVWQRIGTKEGLVEGKLWSAGAFETNSEKVSGKTEFAGFPEVAFESDGTLLAAWQGAISGTPAGIFAATRPPGGEFESPQLLSEPGIPSDYPALKITSKGDALIAWTREDETSRIEAATRPHGASFGPPLPVSHDASQFTTLSPALAVDGQGDAIAAWNRFEGSYLVEFAPYDNAGPTLQSLAIPTQGTAGSPLSFSVSPLDVWSAIGATSWAFGDGSTASAASATHTYATPGKYNVNLSSSDVLGNATSTSGTLTIAPAPPAKGAAGAPALANARQSNRIWREGKRLASFSRKHISRKHKTPVGTVFSFSLNEQAHVSLTFQQKLTGRKAKGKCVAHTSKGPRGRACMHTVIRGTLSLTAHSATNKVSFQGRISRSRMLPPGHYEVLILATNAAKQHSRVQALSFTILK